MKNEALIGVLLNGCKVCGATIKEINRNDPYDHVKKQGFCSWKCKVWTPDRRLRVADDRSAMMPDSEDYE